MKLFKKRTSRLQYSYDDKIINELEEYLKKVASENNAKVEHIVPFEQDYPALITSKGLKKIQKKAGKKKC